MTTAPGIVPVGSNTRLFRVWFDSLEKAAKAGEPKARSIRVKSAGEDDLYALQREASKGYEDSGWGDAISPELQFRKTIRIEQACTPLTTRCCIYDQ